jgi:hypothetical protein
VPKDARLYAKFTLDFPDSHKVMPLSDKAFRALVEMTIYSRRMLTDGFLSKRVALAKWGLEACQDLLDNDPEKPSLIEVENGYIIHDFADHQTTKAELEDIREKRRTAGQKGGRSKALASAKQNASKTPSKTYPETETETETYKPTPNGVGSARKRAARLPADWIPSDSTRNEMREQFPHLDLKAVHAKFVDYWIAKSGRDATKLDWDATFRNWVRRDAEQAPRNGATQGAATTKATGWLEIGQQFELNETYDTDTKAIAR